MGEENGSVNPPPWCRHSCLFFIIGGERVEQHQAEQAVGQIAEILEGGGQISSPHAPRSVQMDLGGRPVCEIVLGDGASILDDG